MNRAFKLCVKIVLSLYWYVYLNKQLLVLTKISSVEGLIYFLLGIKSSLTDIKTTVCNTFYTIKLHSTYHFDIWQWIILVLSWFPPETESIEYWNYNMPRCITSTNYANKNTHKFNSYINKFYDIFKITSFLKYLLMDRLLFYNFYT